MNQKERTQLIAEFSILRSLVHPNIVRYYNHEHVPNDSTVHLYMEFCGGGDLASIIRRCKASGEYIPENMVWSVFTQLALALYRCHYNTDPPPVGEIFSAAEEHAMPNPSKVILHRDIKPDNVFLDEFDNVKLGDFGLAKMLDQEHFMANTYVGTPYYMSPEVLLDKPYTPQSDIWSLGCVIYELCTMSPPFQAKTHLQLSQCIQEGDYPSLPPLYSSTLNKTIAACLTKDLCARPTADTLLKLDIMKLCRREREVIIAQQEVLDLKSQIVSEREMMVAQLQMEQQQIYQQIEEEFQTQVEQEVVKRVNEILLNQVTKAQMIQNRDLGWPSSTKSIKLKPAQFNGSIPADVIMPSNSTMLNRGVRGPRSIHDLSNLSLLNSKSAMESSMMSTSQDSNSFRINTSVHDEFSGRSSVSTYGSSKNSSQHSISSNDDNFTSYIKDSKQKSQVHSSIPRERQAPHFNVIYDYNETSRSLPVSKSRNFRNPLQSIHHPWGEDEGSSGEQIYTKRRYH